MNKKVYQNRLRQMMLKCFALVLFLTAGVTFSSLMAQNQSAATSRTIFKQVSATRVAVTGQMPATAKVAVTPVQRTAVQGKQVKGAYDITIQNGSKAWQPAAGQPVMVSIADPNFTDGEYMDVYHEGANGPEFVATVSPENGKITFPAKSFSVYIVTESGAGARLKVNFHQTDGTVVSIFVKAADATDPETYKTVLYDPGVGSLNDGVQFRGWTENSNYTVNNADDGMTIDEVRTWVQPQLANVTDGTTVDLYPMLFKLYRVTYYDEIGTILSSKEVLFLVNSDQEYHACVINEPYSPGTSEQNFMGWLVTDGGSDIQGYTAGTRYQNETTIYIRGNVKLRADVPYGHWLVFNENGPGASFTAAQFIENGKPTTAPEDPTRFGYTFGGWYTNAECTGTAFTFGPTITEHTTLYAKWTANTTATYTIIIWKQNVHDNKNATDAAKTYDFAESVSLTGPVGDEIETVTAQGTGNNRYALVNGTNKQYPGFHLNTFDENVTIVTEGTSVLNVYYDRNLVTLTFQYRSGNSWATQATMTGLYGSTLESNGYEWPDNRDWYDDYDQNWAGTYSGSGTRTTFLDAFILSDGSDSQTYYGFSHQGNYSIHFMKQNANGTGYTEANTVTAAGGTFYISNKYNGFKPVSYSTNNSTWTNLNPTPNSQGYYGQVSNYTQLYIRFDRVTYNILYEDGVYVDGNNTPVEGYSSRGQLNVAENIPFESSTASYNKGGANYYEPTFAGFVFAGWYIDDNCTQPYTFTTMPEGITVYAKWIQVQYRVFFHPNAVDPETEVNDPTFDWPAGQAFNFRVDYNENVQTPTANRDDYTLVGWYTDEACTQVFNGDMVAVNDLVTTPYDKTVDMTDPVDGWGNIATSGAYNSDATGYYGGDRFWITRKLDLYAKWRSKLEGAKGIHIQYVYIDEENETNVVLVQEEDDIFNDNVTTFSIPAPAPDMVLPGGGRLPNAQDSVFFKWVVMHYDASQEKFVDSDESVYPGSPYTVNKSDAMKEENPDYAEDPTQDQYVYTIQVRAQYVPVEKITPTFIVWYNNYEGAAEDTLRQDGKLNPTDPHANLFINQAVGIPTPAARSGYKFKGWYKANITSQAEVEPVMNVTEPNFLFYNETNSKYYAEAAFTHQADSVAADEANPYDYLYAVWEQTCTVPVVTVDDVTVCQGTTATLTATITNQEDGVDYTYQWYTVNDSEEPAAISTATDATYNAPAAGTYGVIVSIDEDCASEMVTALVTVNELPDVEITTNAQQNTVCEGTSATLTASGATSYVWSTQATTAAITVTPEATTTYTVTGTDDNGCVKTAEVEVTVNELPDVEITTNAQQNTVCEGTSATLTASGATSYVWSTQATTAAIEVTPEETTAYTVTGTDANGCENTAEVTVTVNELPTVVPTATPATICVGETSTLSATGAATYVWDVENTTVAPEETTVYHVTGTDANGCENTAEVTVTVNPLPTVTVTSTPACEGNNAVLTATASNVSYQWKNANGNISGATNATYETATAGDFTIEVTDLTTGCKNTATATAVINPNPVIALDSVRPSCTAKGSLTVTITTETTPDYTYTMNNETPITTNLTEYTFDELSVGTYNFTLADANGCSTTAAQTLTLDQDEIVLTPITMDVCNNYEFDTVPNGANDQIKYAWAAPQCDPNISDALYQSSWATTPQGTIKGKLVNSGSQAGHAVYTVTPTLGDCALGVVTVTVTVDAVVRPEVSLNIDATSPVCANQGDLDVTAEVTNSTLGYTLTWTWQGEETPQTAQVGTGSVTHTIAIPSDVDMPSTYTLQLAYNDGVCRAATSTEIVVNPLPTLTVTPATQTITFGEPMNDVQVDTANASALNVAAPAGFTFNNMILSYNMDPRGNMPPVGTHTIYLNAPGLAPCGTAVDSVKVIVNPRPLTIKVDCEKMYDGTPFVVNYDNEECVTVTGLATGDELTAGKATTAVGTTPSYKVGHYTYTPASGLSFAAIEDGDVLVNPAFASTFGLENYDVTYDIALDITLRPITITAHDSTKMYDGVALTDTIYTISEPGLAVNDTIAMIAQNGSLFCVGTADHTISNALILKTDDNNADVTDQYDITYVDGTLTVTDYTEFECPEDLTIKLNFGQCDTIFEPVELATISEDAPIAEGMYTITNNLDELNPLDTGVHVITWTLTDTCNHIMATCDQTVTVVYRECPVAVDADNNTYQSVRIGCDCWTQTNLVSETYGSEVGGGAIEDVMTYNATPYFDDETANEQTYGHLYTWNAAIKDGADNGYGHIQGICPDGWYLPTKEKYEGLGAYGPEALRADILWADGGGTNTTGFTGLPGGRYVGNILLYRDMTIMDYYWATTTDAAGQASAVEVELTMNCLRVKNVLNTNPNGYSIRCIKEREPETEGTETTEP